MSKVEEELERRARKYVEALRERSIFISVETAMEQVEEAFKKSGKPICGSYYLDLIENRIARDALLEKSYGEGSDGDSDSK